MWSRILKLEFRRASSSAETQGEDGSKGSDNESKFIAINLTDTCDAAPTEAAAEIVEAWDKKDGVRDELDRVETRTPGSHITREAREAFDPEHGRNQAAGKTNLPGSFALMQTIGRKIGLKPDEACEHYNPRAAINRAGSNDAQIQVKGRRLQDREKKHGYKLSLNAHQDEPVEVRARIISCFAHAT